jgi:hypothetical protein
MRLALIGLVALLVLVLDWLALDDITTGREPGFALEWLMLAVSVPALAVLAWLARGRARQA